MKAFLGFIIIVTFILLSCREKVIDINEQSDSRGAIIVDSSPDGAEIYLNNFNMLKMTPDSITRLYPGIYHITLRKGGFQDTTVIVYMQLGDKPSISIELTPL